MAKSSVWDLRWLERAFQGQYLPQHGTTAVLGKVGKVENLLIMIRVTMTLELSYQRIDAITYFTGTCSRISRHWELFFQSFTKFFSSPITVPMLVKLKRNL